MSIKSPLSSVWSGPTVAALRSIESEIERLRQREPEIFAAHQSYLAVGDISQAEQEDVALDHVRAEAGALEEKLTAHAARAASNGLVILDDTFARPVARHGEYLLLSAPDGVLGRLTGGRWRGIDQCEWINPTHETIPESWDWIVKTTPADVVEPAPARAPEIPIVAYRERESRAETGIVKRWEWCVRPVEDVDEALLVECFGRDWRYHYGGTHVVEQRLLRLGVSLEPGPVENTDAVDRTWRPTHLAQSYEDAFEHLDSDVTIVCPTLREIAERRARERREAAALAAERERVARQAEVEREERERHAARSAEAFSRLQASKDGVWAERWNAFASAATPADVERLRADARAVELYDAAIAAETVPAKRKAIKAFLSYVERR